MKRLITIACLFVIGLALHAQPYAQNLTVVQKSDFPSPTVRAYDMQGQVQSRLSFQQREQTIDLNLEEQSRLFTLQLRCDSLVWIGFHSKKWNLLGRQGDSLSLFEISDGQVVKQQLLLHTSEMQAIRSDELHFCFQSADTVTVVGYDSPEIQNLNVRHFTPNQRSIRYVYARANELVIFSDIGNSMLAVEEQSDAQSQSVGLISSLGSLHTCTGSRVYSVGASAGRYILHSLDVHTADHQHRSFGIPSSFFEPYCLSVSNDTVVIVFKNGLVRFDSRGIISADEISFFEFGDTQCAINVLSNKLVIQNTDHEIVLDVHTDSWHAVRVAITAIQTYAPPILIALLLLVVSLRMLRYRRQLRDVLELGSSGISFVVDKGMKVRRMNSRARDLFEMDASTPLRRVLKYYCNGESQRVVESFVASAMAVRGTQTQKLMIKHEGGDKEIIFTAQALHSLSGAFDGLVVSGVDITEELERKRIVNWAQLAHDMQTNLSIIKLNAQQMSGAVAPDHEDQRLRIVHQASLLLQRVRDIVSIGRDEQLHVEDIDLSALFSDVVREFDDESFGDIRFVQPQHPIICRIDRAKMLRAVRNAVENAIRALRTKGGTIELSVQRSRTECIIAVRDDGAGMDEQTRLNFFRPYFSNYRQFGGTGIGTMIMQRAVELHSGSIEVITAPGEGTTIQFKLPLAVYVRG